MVSERNLVCEVEEATKDAIRVSCSSESRISVSWGDGEDGDAAGGEEERGIILILWLIEDNMG